MLLNVSGCIKGKDTHMSLEIHRGKSKWWYGRITVNGRDIVKNLGVVIAGRIPPSLRQVGDLVFERSRARAQSALELLQVNLKRRSSAEELVQTIHEIRTGARVGIIPLKEACVRWKALPRRRPLSARYVSQAESCMDNFITYLKENHSSLNEMSQVQAGVARGYLASEEARGVSPKTYNNILIFLRSCFEALKDDAGIAKNPFAGIPTREEDTIFRKPFSGEELTAIVEAAKEDDFIFPIIVTGICTAMRRGDCCMLKKSSVDLPNRFIQVKTSKTGEYVQIPIFPMLHEVLEKWLHDEKHKDSPQVFPHQAMRYQANPDNITLRVRKVMRKAGFFDPADDADKTDGESNAQEQKSQCPKPTSRGAIHQERTNGLRKASVRDFHSFRVTWVTLALSAGVPLEIVQKVTGHRTASIVMKHYFQPGREEFRKTLSDKLPGAISGQTEKQAPAVISLSEIRAELLAMKPKTWKTIRDELVAKIPEPLAKHPVGAKPLLAVTAVAKSAAIQ